MEARHGQIHKHTDSVKLHANSLLVEGKKTLHVPIYIYIYIYVCIYDLVCVP